jgi:hypothetical protein
MTLFRPFTLTSLRVKKLITQEDLQLSFGDQRKRNAKFGNLRRRDFPLNGN